MVEMIFWGLADLDVLGNLEEEWKEWSDSERVPRALDAAPASDGFAT